MDFNGSHDTSFVSVESNVTSDKDDVSSYLDLRSAILENEQKQKLLQRMVEQQVELQKLQERQKSLLEAQQHVSKLDYVATHDLQAKLGRLQAVKQRITALQKVIDNAEASAPQSVAAASMPMIKGFKKEKDLNSSVESDTTAQNTSTLVNEQLEQLYGTVSNLLSDIDNMNALNQFVGQQETATLQEVASHNTSPRNDMSIPTTPLPYVNLVENKPINHESLPRMKSCQKKSSSDAANSSFVQRHYPFGDSICTQTESPSEVAVEKSTSPVRAAELWEEMRRYQIQLAELQERRKQLASYIKENDDISVKSSSQKNDELSNGSFSSPQGSDIKAYSKSKVIPQTSAGMSMRYFLGQVKPNTVDACTEHTNATWGGSTSTSGDESVGFISQPLMKDQQQRMGGDDESLTRLSTSIEETVYDLWDALDYHNNFLNILLDDQKALSVLLQNTLSMQKDHHISAVLYGISPDFLIYQLDNCSAQILAYQKHIVMLHKELSELQKQYPEIDISYTYTNPPHKSQFNQRDEPLWIEDSYRMSPRRKFLRSQSPMKYYVTGNTEIFSPRAQQGIIQPRSQLMRSNRDASPISMSPKRFYMDVPNLSITVDQINDGGGKFRKVETKQSEESSTLSRSLKSATSSRDVKMMNSKTETTLSKSPLIQKKINTSNTQTFSKTELSDVDSNASGFPLFEALRDSIYSEAATLISQNEARPHFLIELFHELQQLNSDYLRQHCLFVIRDVVNGYIIETPKQKKDLKRSSGSQSSSRKKKSPETLKSKSSYTDLINDMKTLYSENTPSESEADSECPNPQYGCSSDALQYDYMLDVSDASNMTTPQSSQEHAGGDNSMQNPFESDFLGSTVIHLDEALQRVREIERLKQDKSDCQTNGQDDDAEKIDLKDSSENVAQLDAQKLDGKIKVIVSKIIPVIKCDDEVCGEEKISEICGIVSKFLSSERLPTTEVRNKKSDEQLQSVLMQCLNKFLGYHLSECGEELIIDISEVLFNELAYIYMIEDYEEDDDDENKVDDAIIKTMVDEDCDAYEDEDRSAVDESASTCSSMLDETKTNKDLNEVPSNTPASSSTALPNNNGNGSVVVDLSMSETKPLTCYGSGEDEEAGSGEEYDQYNETDDVPTSMQDQSSSAEKKS